MTGMETAIIRGITYTVDEAKVTVRSVPDQPGVAAQVFGALADAHVNVDMIIQNVSEQGHTDISCTVPVDDLPAADDTLKKLVQTLGAKGYDADNDMAKVSVVGAGMRTNPGVAALMFRTLADLGINLEMISTSPIKISCVIEKARVEEAVRALHGVFELDKEHCKVDKADRGVLVALSAPSPSASPAPPAWSAPPCAASSRSAAFRSGAAPACERTLAGQAAPLPAAALTPSKCSAATRSPVSTWCSSPPAAQSKEFVPAAVAAGATVIDKSSTFRMDPACRLWCPRSTPRHSRPQGIIATPNCSTIQMVVALKPIYDAAGIERVVVRPTSRCRAAASAA